MIAQKKGAGLGKVNFFGVRKTINHQFKVTLGSAWIED